MRLAPNYKHTKRLLLALAFLIPAIASSAGVSAPANKIKNDQKPPDDNQKSVATPKVNPQTKGAKLQETGASPSADSLAFSHMGITATIFWVGESAGPDNNNISNAASAWDENWLNNFGGVDDPNQRSGFMPAGFTPKENPFYVALPYSDLTEIGGRKSSANSCPSYNPASSYSWCKNSWVVLRHNDKIAYGQWEDVGPYETNDFAYVFGAAQPKNQWGQKAGIDVSPAIKDFLGMDDVGKVDWSFIPAQSVPDGPWKQITTTTPGTTAN